MIFTEMTNETYQADPALGSGSLKLLAKSPRHYFAHKRDPRRPVTPPTAAMLAGTLAHCALLEPMQLSSRYVVRPEGIDLRTKAGKEWAATVPSGTTVVSAEQMAAVVAQAASLSAIPEIARLFASGMSEVSALWIDEETGVACKCRPDRVAEFGDGVVLFDLKTCPDASPSGFARTVANQRYDLQAAWYSEGYAKASGKPVLGFVFGAVEHEWPHLAATYMLPDDALARANTECHRLLRLYTECEASNSWPGYASSLQILNLPAWANKETQTS